MDGLPPTAARGHQHGGEAASWWDGQPDIDSESESGASHESLSHSDDDSASWFAADHSGGEDGPSSSSSSADGGAGAWDSASAMMTYITQGSARDNGEAPMDQGLQMEAESHWTVMDSSSDMDTVATSSSVGIARDVGGGRHAPANERGGYPVAIDTGGHAQPLLQRQPQLLAPEPVAQQQPVQLQLAPQPGPMPQWGASSDDAASKRPTRQPAAASKRARHDQPTSLPQAAGAILGEKKLDTEATAGLAWAEVLEMLSSGHGPLAAEAVMQRPFKIVRCARRQIFIERPRMRRRPAGDKWLNSGGKKGSTEFWVHDTVGVRKRYGKCAPNDGGPPIPFMEFTVIHRSGPGDKSPPDEEAKAVVAFVLGHAGYEVVRKPPAAPPVEQQAAAKSGRRRGSSGGGWESEQKEQQPSQFQTVNPQDDPRNFDTEDRTAILTSKPGTKFMSFMSEENGKAIELGSIVNFGTGVKLLSAQGDFAEWHKRKPGESAFGEGDVVGFQRGGEISRRTSGAHMLGVISRRAVVEGSAPPKEDRDEYDTVAYTGVVPMKVRRPDEYCHAPETGDIIVPSGRNDGTAVVMSAAGDDAEKRKRLGVVLQGCEWTIQHDTHDTQLVTCDVVSPTETVAVRQWTTPHMAAWALLTVVLTVGALAAGSLLLLPGLVKNDIPPPPAAPAVPAAPPHDPATYSGPPAFEISFEQGWQDHNSGWFHSGTVGDTYRPSLRGDNGDSPRWGNFLGTYTKTEQYCSGVPVYAKVEKSCISYTTEGIGPIRQEDYVSPCLPKMFLYRKSLPVAVEPVGRDPAEAWQLRGQQPDVYRCAAAAKALLMIDGLKLTLGSANEYGSAPSALPYPLRAPQTEESDSQGLHGPILPFAGGYGVRGCYRWTSGVLSGHAFFSYGTCDLDPNTQASIEYQRPAGSGPDGYWAVGVGSIADRRKMDCVNDCHQPQVFASRAVPAPAVDFAALVRSPPPPGADGGRPWVPGCQASSLPGDEWCSGHWEECSTMPGSMCAPIGASGRCTACDSTDWVDNQHGKYDVNGKPVPEEMEWLMWDMSWPLSCSPRPEGRYCNYPHVSTAGGLGPNATWTSGNGKRETTVPTCHDMTGDTEWGFTKDAQDCPTYCSHCKSISIRDYSQDPASANWVPTNRIKVAPLTKEGLEGYMYM